MSIESRCLTVLINVCCDCVLCEQADGVDAEADREVDKVISEITADILSPASAAPTKAPPTKAPAQAATAPPAAQEAVAEDEGPSADELLRRLQAL